MTKIVRWEPMREMITLREAMDRLFDDAFTRPLTLSAGWQVPAVDMYQTDNEVIIEAAVPGMKASDVQISVTGDVLTLRGEIKQNSKVDENAYHIREKRYGIFERRIMLPTDVEADKAKAEFENGILTITLPKAEEVRPKTITVKAK
jgi:HSP20 family protein